LKQAVTAHTDAEFETLIAELIIGDLYEHIAKLRNARLSGDTRAIPMQAYKTAQQCALLIGLANRHLYTTNTTVLAESLALPNRPAGYDAVCQSVLSGEMSDPAKVAEQLEIMWVGIIHWAQANKIPLADRYQDPFDEESRLAKRP
jgi:kanamycin nucleotidyltransferase